jgi:thioesterase domain-containing protein/acyl carrier protein
MQPAKRETTMPETIPPRTNIERELVRIWETVFQRTPIGVREDFFDLGGSSVQAVRIFAEIEETFQKRLAISVIIGAPTIEQLAAELAPGKSRERAAYVVPIQSGGESPALFCIGGAERWRMVAKHLGAEQPVLGIDLEPGAAEQVRGTRAVEKLSRQLVSALFERQEQGPYFLCGYCRDGIFAYEMARQLKLYGHEVRLLALVETRNPAPRFKARVVNGLRRAASRAAVQARELYQLVNKRDGSRYVLARREQLKRWKLRIVSSVFPRSRLRARRSGRLSSGEILYVEACFYQPKPLLCPTVVFRSKDDPIMAGGDPYSGWRELLCGPTETHELPGDHEGIFREPSVRVLADKLRACLQNARQSETREYDVIMDGD